MIDIIDVFFLNMDLIISSKIFRKYYYTLLNILCCREILNSVSIKSTSQNFNLR